MSTIKSSAENLTLNADGANNDIIFQSNGSTKATLDQAGLLTATSFAGSGANLTGVGVDGIVSNANATAITIDSNEKVGIGITSPTSTLHVNNIITVGASGVADGHIVSPSALILKALGNQDNIIFKTDDSDVERMRIGGASGYVGIGTTAPARALHVSDTTSGATTGIRLTGANNGSQVIEFGDVDDTNVGYIQYDHGTNRISIRTDDANRLNIDSDGLKFGTDTAAANALDDYEEGTWTPSVLAGAGVSIGTVYSNSYTKIGRVCTLSASFQVNASNNPTDYDVRFGGFPFSFIAGDNGGFPISMIYSYKATPTLHCNRGGYVYYQNSTVGGNNAAPLGGALLNGTNYMSFAFSYLTT